MRYPSHLLASISSVLCLIGCLIVKPQTSQAQPAQRKSMQTVAEATQFEGTSNDVEVEEFLKSLDRMSLQARLDRIGETNEGRPIHVLFVGNEKGLDLPLAKEDDRLVVVLLGNIHSGECDGKEALLALARDTLRSIPSQWEKRILLAFIPNFNADGNERIGKLHRPGQEGPSRGMGLRENAQNLDLNRDFIKLESPEVRSLVTAINAWKADVLIDAHTTNGSLHRYPLTYDIPHCPTSPNQLTEWLRNEWAPAVTLRMKGSGIETFYYGNFDAEHKKWEGYGYEPRYSTEYMGLRGRIGILSESYSYATYAARVDASYQFIRHCIDILAENQKKIKELFAAADADMESKAAQVSIQAQLSKKTVPVEVLGYAFSDSKSDNTQGERTAPRRKFPSPQDKGDLKNLIPTTYALQLDNRYESKLDIEAPEGYLIPAKLSWLLGRLLLHGVEMQRVDSSELANKSFSATAYPIKGIKKETFQGLTLTRLQVDPKKTTHVPGEEFYLIPTRQPLGRMACYLLEPASDESLATWGFLDGWLEEGKHYPIYRIERGQSLPKGRTESAPKEEWLTLDTLFPLEKKAGLVTPAPVTRWLDETEEYLVEKNNAWFAVDASTGSMRPLEVMRRWTESLQKIDAFANRNLLREKVQLEGLDPTLAWGLIENEDELYLFDNANGVTERLNDLPQGKKKEYSISPSGKHVVYVHNSDIYLWDRSTRTSRRLTHDGTSELLNGILDWVYQEEVYGRGNFRGYWFSPDGQKLAFLKLDESPVLRYQVSDSTSVRQTLEETRYPKSGDPMPLVQLFVYDLATNQTSEVDLTRYPIQDRLVCRVHWHPDSDRMWIQVQNRVQTELSLVECRPEKPMWATEPLLVEKGQAWINVIDAPRWLPNGDFLWLSDLPNGRRHLYRIDRTTGARTAMTSGDWEVEKIVLVEPDGKTAWVTGNPQVPVELHLIRVDLEKGTWKPWSNEPGTHRVSMHRSGKFVADTFSSIQQRPTTTIHDREGKALRKIHVLRNDRDLAFASSNPELFTIPARDQQPLQSMLWSPPSADRTDPNKKYPVLIHVYAGPKAPTVKNQWPFEANLWHPYVAQHGIFVLQSDNRAARGRGFEDTWKVHRQLGTIELQDLEDTVTWLKKQPWVDPDRIGIWGWSYGGYFTAYAMTHTNHFRAGIAGAPVTDWRNYDSIYTERYMGLPAENEAGYRKASVVESAKNLHGRLFLIHGEQDDNVHISNTIQLAQALQQSNKLFDMMIYPKNRHSVNDPLQRKQMYQQMTDFLLRHLRDVQP